MQSSEAAEVLRGKGYVVNDEDGVVVVLSGDKADKDRAGKILKRAGYRASYGWRKSDERSDG